MNINSGVGDNAFGRYMGGSGRRGGSMFSNSRQMRQYMQMRRDEMSHGAFLQNQNDALADERGEGIRTREAQGEFNRQSLRADADVAQNDWQKGRNTFHLGEVRKTDPNVTAYSTDGPGFSFGAQPGLHPQGRAAQERFKEMQDTGHPLFTPPTGGGPAGSPTPVSSERVLGAPKPRLALEAPARPAASRGPRGPREPRWTQPTLPGMRNTRQFKNVGNELDEVTGPKNAAGTGGPLPKPVF